MNQENHARVALVTGGSRGIGEATSRLLASRGVHVVVNYKSNADDAERVVSAIEDAGGTAMAAQADVCDPAAVERLVRDVARSFGPVDILVHNALIPYVGKSFAEITWAELEAKTSHELKAAFYLTKAVIPEMRQNGFGRLVYVSTVLANRPRQNMMALGTAKAALAAFARFIAQEHGPDGITANVVAPGPVDTTQIVTIMGPFGEQRERIISDTPLGRLALPEDVARVIAFFAGDDGTYVTGSVMPVTGGHTMG